MHKQQLYWHAHVGYTRTVCFTVIQVERNLLEGGEGRERTNADYVSAVNGQERERRERGDGCVIIAADVIRLFEGKKKVAHGCSLENGEFKEGIFVSLLSLQCAFIC